METNEKYIKRFAEARVSNALENFKVVCVTGPRQCGKTTMLERFANDERPYFDLEDEETFDSISGDISGFLGRERKAIIDEVHRLPKLMYNIKSAVDHSEENGRYIISTSLSFETLARLSDSLAGRLYRIKMLPLSQTEINGVEPCFLDCVESGQLPDCEPISEADFFEMALLGGYPRAVTAGSLEKGVEWLNQYLDQMSELDYKEEGNLRVNPDKMMEALMSLAASCGSKHSKARLIEEWGVATDTGNKIFATFDRLRLMSYVGVLSQNRKQKKIEFLDTGVLACLLNLSLKNILLTRNHKERGKVFESFVHSELCKQITARGDRSVIKCYRDKRGREIDFIIETADRELIAIEAKSSRSLKSESIRNIREFARNQGKKFKRGIVLNLGRNAFAFGKQDDDPRENMFWLLPVSSLFSGKAT